ncbi:O-antigen ligase family protein [Dissulfuribacter thermophilus]|uniref:O-antigen ligase family protein n=1 Tax=Dissulfuribacter thermophilus TaxID=1156395 RepID=UPI001FC95679|nr:O-antigen ligase family protein [Dissulfuribacter thermophilus]
MVQVLITTQSRGVWLFLMVILVSMALGSGINMARAGRVFRDMRCVAGIIIVSFMALVAWYEAGTIQKRLLQERDDAYKILRLDVDSLPYETSIGIRAHVWCFGVRTWLLSPVLGWGPGTNALSSPFFETKARFSSDEEREKLPIYATHLHSDPIESLVRLGLIGTCILGAIFLSLVYGLVRARINGAVSSDVFLFLLSSISLMFLFSLIEFRIVHVPYRNLLLIISSIVLGLSHGESKMGLS